MTKDTVRRWFQEVWTEGRESTIDELLDPRVEIVGIGGLTLRGIDEFKLFWRAARARFEDMSIHVHDLVEEDGKIAAVCSSEFLDVATGRRVTMRGTSVTRIENGRFVHAVDTWDFGDVLEQLGVNEPGTVMKALIPTAEA